MEINRFFKTTCLALAIIFTCSPSALAARLDIKTKPSLQRVESEVRLSTSLIGELADSLEIIGVTVLPLVKSGNVAFESSDSYSKKTDIGSLLNIYVKNNSAQPISPQVTFNGKTASALIDLADNTVSWANTPDTRVNRKYDKDRDVNGKNEFVNFIPLSDYIPAGAVDCYSINVCDAKLLYDGIAFEIVANGKTATATLFGDYPYVTVSRLMWQSTTNEKWNPDEVIYYIDNKSAAVTTVNYVKFYDGTDEYSLHYWHEASDKISAFQNIGIIVANQPASGTVNFANPLAFKEYLVEFNITNNGRTYSVIQKTKPLINEFDISVGWAGGDMKQESYIKAISSMHFNTVIGAFGNDYYLRSKEFREQYPLKIFGYNEDGHYGPVMQTENGVVTVYALEDVHAALPFGEPQLNDNADNFQPMRVFNKLLMYRNSCYPTNVTLSHEPFFYRYAGLSDLNHYDAYRIAAPFSDAWYKYFEYADKGKYGIYWGAPLETIGDYMRTLAKLNYPNTVAAWTQGANTWNGIRRFTDDPQYYYSPNPFELRMQAYENMANGAAALYWFNINAGDLLFHKPGSRETLYVNRELSVVKDYIAHQVPYFYERTNNYDVNLNMGTDYALLYVMDLNYAVKKSMYQYNGMRNNQSFSFKVPAYLHGANSVVKITKDGVSPCDYAVFNGSSVTITDDVDMTALYVLGNQGLFSTLSAKYSEVLNKESYNYLDNSAYYRELQAQAGYSDENPYLPNAYTEQGTTLYKILYAIASLFIHPLESLVTKLASIIYGVTRFFNE